MINFDPIYITSSRRAKQKIKLIFAMWEYRYESIIDVEVNISGVEVINYAFEKLFDQISDNEDSAILIMTDIWGNRLETSDDERQEHDWLKSMLISAEIISFQQGRSI